jgi:putative transposase
MGDIRRCDTVARVERSETRGKNWRMVRYRRNLVAGATYFFTITLADRRASTLVDYIDALRQAIQAIRDSHPFRLDAVVVLPDHLHVLATLPVEDADFSIRISLLKRRFTEALVQSAVPVPRGTNGEYKLWQRRFWEHTIRNDEDFERHADYIHFNPVKHGLVKRVRDWPYSSFHDYVRRGVLPPDWGGDFKNPLGGFGEP